MANVQHDDFLSDVELEADRYRLLFENSPDPILTEQGDPDGVIA